jgi:SAM-dependent methyltransferase
MARHPTGTGPFASAGGCTVSGMAEPWEDSADAYAQSFARLCGGTADEILRRLGPRTEDQLLLDIGTGPGTVAAAAHISGSTVIGMDPDHSMTTLAARRHPGIPFARAALPRLPCPNQSFDAITANFVINHTPDPRAATRELLRALRTGGQLVATIWTSQVAPLNQLWNDVISHASVSPPPPGTRLPPELDFERTIDGFAGILNEAGFDQIDCQETTWNFEITPEDLWIAVEAGIAVIGQTYRAQDLNGRTRMRTAYDKITSTRTRYGGLALPSVALIASAQRHQC